MATRFKTVEYAWDNVTTATAETTVYTSGDITITIPETASRVFKFALLELTAHDNEGTVADDISAINIGMSCNGGTNWTDRNITTTLADTAENMGFIITADVTAELIARFSGTSNSTTRFRCQFDYASTGNSFLNIGAKLIITYQYDDAGVTTQLKTVRIPIQSSSTRLTNSLVDIGGTGSQIPILNSYLPEAGKVYRDLFFELWCNTQPGGTTANTLTLQLDGSTENFSGSFVFTAQSPFIHRRIWKQTNLTDFGSLAHVIKARASAATSYFNNLGGWLTATYEYDVTNTGSVMNSLFVAAAEEDGIVGASTEPNRDTKILWIEEPNPITLVDSAVIAAVSPGATSTSFYIRVGSATGSQLLGSYVSNAQTGQGGQQLITHKFGSGWATPYGSGLTLHRGRNEFFVDWYSGAASRHSNFGAAAIINYISGVQPGGSVETHNKSVLYLGSPCLDTQRATAVKTTWVGSYAIPESQYFINGVLFIIDINSAATVSAQSLRAEYTTTEPGYAGMVDLYNGQQLATSERSPWRLFGKGRTAFRRYPTDPDTTRLWFGSSRTFVYETLLTNTLGVHNYITYHSINYGISGSVGSYSGVGTGIPVYAYRSDNRELIGSTVTTTGGAYTIPWYDNYGSVFTEAYESGSRVGRSPDGGAS